MFACAKLQTFRARTAGTTEKRTVGKAIITSCRRHIFPFFPTNPLAPPPTHTDALSDTADKPPEREREKERVYVFYRA